MKKYFDYLDRLRDSGVTNMYGATPYLQRKFPELSFDHAQAVYVLFCIFRVKYPLHYIW
jgi:hypothetical protein